MHPLHFLIRGSGKFLQLGSLHVRPGKSLRTELVVGCSTVENAVDKLFLWFDTALTFLIGSQCCLLYSTSIATVLSRQEGYSECGNLLEDQLICSCNQGLLYVGQHYGTGVVSLHITIYCTESVAPLCATLRTETLARSHTNRCYMWLFSNKAVTCRNNDNNSSTIVVSPLWLSPHCISSILSDLVWEQPR